MRGLLLSLLVVTGLSLTSQRALAVSCSPTSATEIKQRGDVAATGTVDSFVPLGFIFATDHVYKGDLPAHVLVLGQYRPPAAGIRFFAVMRFHVPGVYSMDVCDGRTLENPYLGVLGDEHSPSPDLPISQAAIAFVVGVIALLLIRARRGRGNPPTFAGAAP